jgi:hypothetical protein
MQKFTTSSRSKWTVSLQYQGTDILPETFSSSPDTPVFVARKLHEGASPRLILSDKHEFGLQEKISGDIYLS